MNEKMNK